MMRTHRPPRVAAAILLALASLSLPDAAGASPSHHEPLTHGPVIWYEGDRNDIEEPEERDPSLVGDIVRVSFVYPTGRNLEPATNVRRVGRWLGLTRELYPESRNVNALDEVPNSSWFTNRIGLAPMTAEEMRAGSGGAPPDTSGPWTIIRAKTEGVTPGFTIRDARGDTYLIKFDRPEFPRMSTGAGVITARLFHAIGYNVPQDFAIRVSRDRLHIGGDTTIKVRGKKVPMEDHHVEEMLARVARADDGRFYAIASKYVDGKPIGPFNYRGRRDDDPNDQVDHQHRRELRALNVIAGWVNHFDTKQHNSLDVYTEEGGHRFVKHYLIDFASTIGTGAGVRGPRPQFGYEYGFNAPNVGKRLLSLGLWEDTWRKLMRSGDPALAEVGYWQAEHFDPRGFQPALTNTAFALCTERDGYWAAKVISAIPDDLCRVAVAQADFESDAATEFVGDILIERRDLIARSYFLVSGGVDFFRADGESVTATDLGVERDLWSASETRYRARVRPVDADRNALEEQDWRDVTGPRFMMPDGSSEFVEIELQVRRGDSAWSRSTRAYWSRPARQIVAVER